jgi:plasmid stability protein
VRPANEGEIMSQPFTIELMDVVIQRLRERAARNSRSPESEAAIILTQALLADPKDPWAIVRAIHDDLAATGRDFGDSVAILREERER